MLCSAQSLGAGEHEAARESESRRALFETITSPTVERESGNCAAGVALTFSPLPVYVKYRPQVSREALHFI